MRHTNAPFLLPFITTAAAFAFTDQIHLSDRVPPTNRPGHAPPGFVAFGDSYSAGIGAVIPSPEDCCRHGYGAHPYLIASDLLSHSSSNTTSPFQWLSCTGATTKTILSSPSLNPPSQIDTFNSSLGPPDFALLSAGGNDVHFFDVINACIFRFYGPWSGSCAGALDAAEARLAHPAALKFRLRLLLVEVLDKIRWEVRPDFTITMTGYARFFNDKTEGCDKMSMGIWASSGHVVRRREGEGDVEEKGIFETPYLTREVRGRLNRLVVGVNEVLREVADDVDRLYRDPKSRVRVLFVDYDDAFEGRRFCEEGVDEPDYGRNETLFFLPGSVDVGGLQGNETSSALVKRERTAPVDVERCLEHAERSGDWGEMAVCYMARTQTAFPEMRLRDEVRMKAEDDMWYVPTYYGKTFHPRSSGHRAIRDKIYEVWRENGLDFGQGL